VSVDEEVCAVDLFERRSSVGFQRQQAADEVAGGHGDVRRDGELVADDPHVRLFQRRRLERRPSAQQRVPAIM